MFENRAAIFGWVFAILIVVGMGLLVFTGPYHTIAKAPSKASSFSPVTVKIVTDPKTIGSYQPATITVHVGQKVSFTNVSDAPHTVTAKNTVFNSGDINTGGASWSYVATKSGTFPYYCIYHPRMFGTLVVKA